MEKIKLSDNIKLLNQGTYGCVFKKGITCDGMVDEENTISKIVEHDITSENETNIGKKIMNISDYSYYFAPILQTCEIDMTNMESEELNKCKIIQSNKNKKHLKFQMNKIAYIGNKNILTYLLDLLENENKIKNFSTEFFNIFIRLLEGYSLLHKQEIIHMDVKANNLIVNEKKSPIIIDFGISFDIGELTEAKELDTDKETYYDLLNDIFFNPEDKYQYWCFDIFVINYAMNNVLFDTKNRRINDMPVNIDDLIKCADIYFGSNNGIIHLLEENEKQSMKENHLTYLKEMSNYDDQTKINNTMWMHVIGKLLENAKTWDIYGLIITYLEIFNILKIKEQKDKVEYLQTFYKLLKTYMKEIPTKRMSTEELNKVITTQLQSITTKERHETTESLKKVLESPQHVFDRNQNVQLSVERSNNTELKK